VRISHYSFLTERGSVHASALHATGLSPPPYHALPVAQKSSLRVSPHAASSRFPTSIPSVNSSLSPPPSVAAQGTKACAPHSPPSCLLSLHFLTAPQAQSMATRLYCFYHRSAPNTTSVVRTSTMATRQMHDKELYSSAAVRAAFVVECHSLRRGGAVPAAPCTESNRTVPPCCTAPRYLLAPEVGWRPSRPERARPLGS